MQIKATVMFAKDLKNVNLVHRMDAFVTVSLSGCEQRTPVHTNGGTSPYWGHPIVFPFDEVKALTEHLDLEFVIMTKKTIGGDKEVGRFEVPVKELVEKQGDEKPTRMSCSVRLPSGRTQGFLDFFYEFGEFNAAPSPPPTGNGYTPQGYGHPLNVPQAAYPEPPRKSGGLVEGLVRGTMLGNIVLDASEGLGMLD